MAWIRALAPALGAACLAIVSLSAPAQTPADGKRQKVDVRAMVPGPQASDAAAEPRPASGLTRDERKEATLQARREGTLRPAGEAADTQVAATPPPAKQGTPLPAGEAAAPTQVAAATPPPAKKVKSKKARLSASAPA